MGDLDDPIPPATGPSSPGPAPTGGADAGGTASGTDPAAIAADLDRVEADLDRVEAALDALDADDLDRAHALATADDRGASEEEKPAPADDVR